MPLFEKLSEHYQDTYGYHINTLNSRNRLFFALLILTGLFTVDITSPDLAQDMISQAITKGTGIHLSGSSAAITSILWLAVTGLSIRYFQLAVQIERQYPYLHSLESELNAHYPKGSIAFTREGETYLNAYPLFQKWLHAVYTKLFPFLLFLITLTNFLSDIGVRNWSQNDLLNAACFLVLLTTILLYVLYLRKLN